MPDSETNLARKGYPLTPREREVLTLLASGMSTKNIAEQLGIAAGTVKVHLTGIFRKTGAADRVEAARYYLDNPRPAAAVAGTVGLGSANDRDDENVTRADLRPDASRRRARLSRRELQVLMR